MTKQIAICSDCGTEECVAGEILCFTSKTANIIYVDKYQPSNGSEGMSFMAEFCDICTRQPINPDDGGCEILGRTLMYNSDDPKYPTEWRYGINEKAICTKFLERDLNG